MLNAGTAGPSTPTEEPSTPSFAEFIGDTFGDFLPVDESPALESTDAGTPPADATGGADQASGSEGVDAAAERAGTPPADAAPAALDAAGNPVDPSADVDLSAFTPFAYQSDGQTKTIEGIREHPDGAIVDAEFLPQLRQLLSERDHLHGQRRQDYDRYQTLEKATTWPVRNAQGQLEQKTGLEALELQRAAAVRLGVLANAVMPILQGQADPAQFIAWDEAQGKVVWNTPALQSLYDKAQFDGERAAWQTSRTFDQYRTALTAQAPAADTTPVASLAMPTVESTAQHFGITNLTPESKQFLASQLERYVRPTTPEERQQDPTLGTRIVDASFIDLVRNQSTLLAATAKTAQAASSATERNAARFAAAGRKAVTRPVAPTSPTNGQPSRAQTAADAWDLAERAGAAALRSRAGQ